MRPKTLPADYVAQYAKILQDMKLIGVSHNDIFIPGHKMELHVQNKMLFLVDFGWATVNGSYATCPGVSSLAPPEFVPIADDKVMDVLHQWSTTKTRTTNPSIT